MIGLASHALKLVAYHNIMLPCVYLVRDFRTLRDFRPLRDFRTVRLVVLFPDFLPRDFREVRSLDPRFLTLPALKLESRRKPMERLRVLSFVERLRVLLRFVERLLDRLRAPPTLAVEGVVLVVVEALLKSACFCFLSMWFHTK